MKLIVFIMANELGPFSTADCLISSTSKLGIIHPFRMKLNVLVHDRGECRGLQVEFISIPVKYFLFPPSYGPIHVSPAKRVCKT